MTIRKRVSKKGITSYQFRVSLGYKDLKNIDSAYAITIHKSQGSEFDLVVIPICHSYKRMLYRKLIYTGITRAKKKLIIIGEPNAFIDSVNSNYEQVRKSDMIDKLRDICINNNY